MDYLPTGISDLILILGCMTSDFLALELPPLVSKYITYTLQYNTISMIKSVFFLTILIHISAG